MRATFDFTHGAHTGDESHDVDDHDDSKLVVRERDFVVVIATSRDSPPLCRLAAISATLRC